MSAVSLAVSLSKDSVDELNDLAAHRGVSADALIQQAVEGLLTWERETLAAHEEGISQIERGDFYTNEEVRSLLDVVMRERTAA